MSNLHPKVSLAESAFGVAADKFLAGEYSVNAGEKRLNYNDGNITVSLFLKDATLYVEIFDDNGVAIIKFVYGFDGFVSEYAEAEVFNTRKNLVLMKLMMY